MSDDFSQQDENRKTLRSFYCRDYMWDLFEQMTRDLGCSMDYLINEAMRQYAQNRDYSPSNARPEQDRNTQGNYSNPSASGGNPGSRPTAGGPEEHRTFEQVPSVGPGQQQNQPSGGNRPETSSSSQPQKPQPGGGSSGPPPPPNADQGRAPNQNQPNQNQQNFQRDQQPPTKRQNQSPGGGYQQQQPQQQQQQQQQSSRGTLYLLFNNNRYEIDRDRFVIGRGSSNTDLTIRDGNISRQHCAIIYRNNNWYLKDLDSTNGIEYRGNRIESKRIEEGDVFYLCDYPLQFTYRG